MADVKKSEIVEAVTVSAKPTDTAVEYGKIIASMKKSREKISNDIEINDMRELIIKNTAELLAIRAIRDRKLREKISKTQMIMNKFKKIL